MNMTAAICVSLLVFVFSSIFGQISTPTPLPSPSPTLSVSGSPTATPTPSPSPKPTPTPLPGAQNFHRWGSITVFNGLPSDSVRAIAQTTDGVMWFGTDNGLARFDGRRVQNFSFGESDSNRVLALKTSPAGQLWIGTQKGAYLYSENRFQPVEGTQSIGITSILLSGENFLGTDAGLVLRAKANGSGTLTAEPIFPDPILADDGSPLRITSLIENDGKLLAGTPGRGAFVVQDGGVSEFPTAPRPIFVNSLARSETGKLWLGTDAVKGLSGIYSAESGSRAERIAAPTANVLALETNESGLWAGTERYGLFHVAESRLTKTYTFANTSGGLRSDTIFTLLTDREGVLWIGTNRGVSRFDRHGAFQETVSDIPNSNFVRTVYQMRDVRSYAGTNRGLFIKDEDRRWVDVPSLGNKVIYAISNRPGGQIIVGTPEGVFDLSGKKLFDGDVRGFASFSHFPHAESFSLRQYAAVWGRGFVDITGSSAQTVFPNETVTSVCVPVIGNRFWIGTAADGLFSFNGQTVKKEADALTLGSGAIWKMFDDGTTLFLAAENGVFTFRDGKVEKIVAADDVRDVFSRDGQVWAATTTRGLLHARHDERFGWLVSSIGFEQGLPSEKAFFVRPYDDELIIATNRGIVTYRPGTVAPKLIPVRVLSQRMHDLGELRSTIELEYPQNSLLVEVAGQSSRTFPEEFQYAHLLRNALDEIVDSRLSNDPQYAPRDLSPGEYSIESRAFNRDLLTSEPLILRFSVAKAPFPLTATALGILLIIALIALSWAIVERRRIARSNSELAAARFDLANEAERERSRIARDLHDQTLADLRNLMMMSDRLSPPNTEFRAEIESVSTEIRRICEDLSPSVLENVGLVAALEFLLGRSIENHRFSASEDANDLVKFPVIVQLHIYRIAQEVLTNIIRHSSANLVEMSVEVFDDERFLLTISDNGPSFQPEGSIGNGRGISNIRSRANIINAKIAWEEGTEGGNFFSLEIAGKSA